MPFAILRVHRGIHQAAGRQSAQKCQVSYGLVPPTHIYCARYHSTIPVYDELVALLANELNPISFPGTECSRHGAVRKRATGSKMGKRGGRKGGARAGSPSFFSGVRGFSPSTDQQGFPERLRDDDCHRRSSTHQVIELYRSRRYLSNTGKVLVFSLISRFK